MPAARPECASDLSLANGRVWRGKQDAAGALVGAQRLAQAALDERRARWDRLSGWLLAEWGEGRAMSHAEQRKVGLGLLFVSPWLVGFLVFFVYPLACAVYYSCCDYSVLTTAAWVSPANYRGLFTDRRFWQAMGNTLFFEAFSILLGFVVSFSLALLVMALFQFMATRSDFLGTLLYLAERQDLTLVLGLKNFQTQHGGTEWHYFMAGTTLVVLPMICLFFLAQRSFIEGIATTGGK